MGGEPERGPNRIAVIGEPERVQGYSLVGAVVYECPDAESVRKAWDALGDDVAVVVLTAAAAEAVSEHMRPAGERRSLTVVLPS